MATTAQFGEKVLASASDWAALDDTALDAAMDEVQERLDSAFEEAKKEIATMKVTVEG